MNGKEAPVSKRQSCGPALCTLAGESAWLRTAAAGDRQIDIPVRQLGSRAWGYSLLMEIFDLGRTPVDTGPAVSPGSDRQVAGGQVR